MTQTNGLPRRDKSQPFSKTEIYMKIALDALPGPVPQVNKEICKDFRNWERNHPVKSGIFGLSKYGTNINHACRVYEEPSWFEKKAVNLIKWIKPIGIR